MAARRRCAYKLFGTDGQTDRQTDRQTDGQTEKFNTISLRFTGDNKKIDDFASTFSLPLNVCVSLRRDWRRVLPLGVDVSSDCSAA